MVHYVMTAEESTICWENLVSYHKRHQTEHYVEYITEYAKIRRAMTIFQNVPGPGGLLSVDDGNTKIKELGERFFANSLGATLIREPITDPALKLKYMWKYTVEFPDDISLMEFKLKWL